MRAIFGICCLIVTAATGCAQQMPAALKCEYQTNPLVVGTAVPRFSWEMTAPAGARGVVQSAYRIEAGSSQDAADMWDSGKVASDETLQIEYAGKPLHSLQRVYWRVKTWDNTGTESDWSKSGQFTTGLLDPADWTAKWIAFPNDDADKTTEPSPIFRREFSAGKPIARATAYICGLGQYELTVNGQKVGDAVLGPAWTMYRKTCDYDALDITSQLKSGANAIGVMLGNGMYNVAGFKGPNGQRTRYSKFTGTMGVPKLIAQFEIEYADGSHERINTDSAWSVARGAVLFSHPYGGEDYDARLEQLGWDTVGFAGKNWQPSQEVPGPGDGHPRMEAAMAPPIRVKKSYDVVKITHPNDNSWVYDFGQNLAGWPHMKLTGPAGATVKLIPGELLAPDGTVSQKTFHGPTWLSYTLKGTGTEDWHPRFATLGYRYVEVQGAAPAPESQKKNGDAALLLYSTQPTTAKKGDIPIIQAMTSEFVHGDIEPVGTFVSSDDTLNKIHALINAAILSNTQSVLTDCPHREKLGWLEQSHLMADAIGMNYDLSQLYTKMCRDMRDSQTADGLVPTIAPEYTLFQGSFRDTPEWGSAAVIDPWFLYRMYGDRRILREQYDGIKRYVDYLGTKATDGILDYGLGDWYDIGPKRPGVAQLTTKSLTSTATYFYDLSLLVKMADLLGEKADSTHYKEIADHIRPAFNQKFFHAADAKYENGSQTAQAMPVAMGLTDEANVPAVVNKLADDIKAGGYRVTAGDVGFSYVVRALTEGDRGDVMLHMMLQSDGPGYVMQLRRGATALTEAWDASPSSSNNHLMLGHGEAWLFQGLGGIRQEADSIGWKHVLIAPQVVGDVGWVKTSYDSPRGLIECSWKREGAKLTTHVVVPPNSTATVRLPAADVDSATESGKGIANAGKISNPEKGMLSIELGSGSYDFTTTLPH